MTVPQSLKTLRKILNLSQRDFALAVGLEPTEISKMERGKAKLNRWAGLRMQYALGVQLVSKGTTLAIELKDFNGNDYTQQSYKAWRASSRKKQKNVEAIAALLNECRKDSCKKSLALAFNARLVDALCQITEELGLDVPEDVLLSTYQEISPNEDLGDNINLHFWNLPHLKKVFSGSTNPFLQKAKIYELLSGESERVDDVTLAEAYRVLRQL